jgi:hypothetical protein
MEEKSTSEKEGKKNLPYATIGTMVFILITSGLLLWLLKCEKKENGLSTEKIPSAQPALKEISEKIQTLDKKIEQLSGRFKDLGPDYTLHSHQPGYLSWEQDPTIDYLKSWPQQHYNFKEWEATLKELKKVADSLGKVSEIKKVASTTNFANIYGFFILIIVLTIAGNTTIAILSLRKINQENIKTNYFQWLLSLSATSLFISLIMQSLGLLANLGSTPLLDEKQNLICLLISMIFYFLSFPLTYRYIFRLWKFSKF